MIFFFKSDGTLIKSAPETVYQGSAEAGKVYVVAPLNANMLVDVYYELPNGERWGAYLLENNGTVINNEELPDGWALWSTTLESAITQYAGTLKAQFGFYQSGTADKVPLITSQGVTITIAKGVVRDLPSAPTADVYAKIVNAISSIKQDIANLPNEYLSNTNEDKIALKNNSAIEYSENATAGTIVKRDSDGKINVADGTEDLNAVNVRKLNAELETKVTRVPIESGYYNLYGENHDGQIAVPFSQDTGLGTIPQRTTTGQLKAADGVADDDLATVKQLNAVQGNYTDITNIDLNTGDTTVEYDTELGITVNAKGTVTHKNGDTEQPTTKFELPIIAGDGIVIDKAQNEEKISVKVDGEVTETPNSIVKRDSAGRVKTADAVSDEDAVSYGQQKALRNYTDAELLKKLAKIGGTITGNLIVSGNLSVSGKTSVIESTTLKVADKLIYVAKDNISALTSPAGLITPKYDGTNDGGLVYDNSGTAYVGDIKLDSNGNVDVNNSDLQPIATRDNYSNFTNGHKVKVEVDSLQKSVKFVDGGKDDGINTLTDVNLTLGDTTVQYDTTDGIQINSTARFTAQGTNHDAMMDIALPVVGKNGIIIDKAADAEKIEVKVDNSKIFNVNTELLIFRSNYNRVPYLPKNERLLPESYNPLLYVDDDGRADVGDIPAYVSSSVGDTIVGDGGGVLITDNPTKPYQASNKKYVDDGFVAKITTSTQDMRVYGVRADGTQFIFPTSQNVPEIDHIAQYTTGNNIRTNTPIDNLDAVNKKYGTENYFNKAETELTPTTGDTVSKEQLKDLNTGLYGVFGHKIYGLDISGYFNLEVFHSAAHRTYLLESSNNGMYVAQILNDTDRTFTGWVKLATTAYVDKKVDISENFVKAFTIPNGTSTGTLAADVKEKLCNPDGHNYYVFDDTSQMILKYSFNADDEIIQYKAIYLQTDKAYEITMQILPSNGSWRRSQTVLNGATANPTLTGTEAELTGLKVGGTNYKIPIGGGSGKLYKHSCSIEVSNYTCNLTFFDYQSAPHTIESAYASPRIGYSLSSMIDMKVCFGIIDSFADNGYVQWYLIPYRDAMTGSSVDTYSVISIFGQKITSLTDTVTEI